MNNKVKQMVGIGVFCAIVIVLQYIFGGITIGGTSINPVLVPVVVGAAIYGWQAGAILGLVSGVAILLISPPSFFYGINFVGTIVTVLAKGAVSGLVAGLAYKLISRKNKFVAVLTAAILCPLVNTGLFLAGCYIFFYEGLFAGAAGGNFFIYLVTTMVGVNIFVELGINMVMAPAITRLIKIGQK